MRDWTLPTYIPSSLNKGISPLIPSPIINSTRAIVPYPRTIDY